MGETYSVCVPLADLANFNHTVSRFPPSLMEDTARPKRKRTRYTRGKGRRINLKGGSGQPTQTSSKLVMWDSDVYTPKMENEEAMDPGMKGPIQVSVSFLSEFDTAIHVTLTDD